MRDRIWNKISNKLFPDEVFPDEVFPDEDYTNNMEVLCSRLTIKPKQIVIVSTPKGASDEKIFTYID